MPRQLVYASVSSGLAPGRSGYCTAARSPGLRDRIVRELELASSHEVGEGEAYTFNVIRLAGDTFAVLTRYGDAGPDYTGRASTIAHHLVFEAGEIASLPPPADIARRFPGWIKKWEGPARQLSDHVSLELSGAPSALPAATWKKLSGDAGKAALFCDDSGRATNRNPPLVGLPDTLALLGEASLLLEDKGWTTPFTTRRKEPDSWAVWHASSSVDPATLPDPGLTRRATLARSGVMAGMRPGTTAAKVPGAGRPTRAASGKAASSAPSPTTLYWAAGGLSAIVAAIVIVLLVRSSGSARDEAAKPAAAAPAGLARVIPAQVNEALTALAQDDLFRAANAWLELKKADPAVAEENAATILEPVRTRLVPATLSRITREISRTGEALPAGTISGIRKTMTEMEGLARTVGAVRGPADSAGLTTVSETLGRMEKFSAAFPESTFVEVNWSKDDDSPEALQTSATCGETPALRNFLTLPRAAMRVSVSDFEGFGLVPKRRFETSVPAKDYSPARALAVKDATYGQVFTLVFDVTGRLSLTRRRVKVAPQAHAPFGSDRAIAVTLTDAKTGESHNLVIFTPADSPKPLALSAKSVVMREGEAAPEAWLAGSLYRRVHAVRRPALIPSGYNGDTREYPGLEASRSIVEQALRVRLADARPAGKAAMESLLAGLPANLTDAGAPWAVVIVPTGSATPRTIIDFSAP